MEVMRGIQYVTDPEGKRVAVQINLKLHGALWEDFADALVAEGRRREKGVPLAKVKQLLQKRPKGRA